MVAAKQASKQSAALSRKKFARTARSRSAAKRATTLASFHIARSPRPFLSLQLTRQTVYWGVLSFVIFTFGIWVIAANQRIMAIYDQVDFNHAVQAQSEARIEMLARSDKKQ